MRSPVLVSPVWPKMAVVPLEGPGGGRRARAEVPVPRELLETKLVVPKEVAKDLVSVVLRCIATGLASRCHITFPAYS